MELMIFFYVIGYVLTYGIAGALGRSGGNSTPGADALFSLIWPYFFGVLIGAVCGEMLKRLDAK